MYEWLFPMKELRLELGKEPTEVISILRSRTRAPGVRILFYTGLVGSVDERRVQLRYKVAWRRNGFEEAFTGRFESLAGRAFLVGRLRQRLGGRVYFLVWSGIIVLFWIASLVLAVKYPDPRTEYQLFVLFPPALIALGVGILKFHQRRARTLNARLESELRAATATPDVIAQPSQ